MSGGNLGAAGTSAFSGRGSGFPAASSSYSSPIGSTQPRQYKQQSPSLGQGGFSVLGRTEPRPMDTMDGLQEMDSNTPQGPGSGQATGTHTTNDVKILTAQLAEAMAVVGALQQQNKAMGAEMRDMRAQMHEERMERKRYLSASRGAQAHSIPMKRSPQAAEGAGDRGGSRGCDWAYYGPRLDR